METRRILCLMGGGGTGEVGLMGGGDGQGGVGWPSWRLQSALTCTEGPSPQGPCVSPGSRPPGGGYTCRHRWAAAHQPFQNTSSLAQTFPAWPASTCSQTTASVFCCAWRHGGGGEGGSPHVHTGQGGSPAESVILEQPRGTSLHRGCHIICAVVMLPPQRRCPPTEMVLPHVDGAPPT